jgi:hypothetical protein
MNWVTTKSPILQAFSKRNQDKPRLILGNEQTHFLKSPPIYRIVLPAAFPECAYLHIDFKKQIT